MSRNLHKIRTLYKKKEVIIRPAKDLYTFFATFKKIEFETQLLAFVGAYVALEREYGVFLKTGDLSFKWFLIRLISSLKRNNHLDVSEYQKLYDFIVQDFSDEDNLFVDFETPKSIFAQQVIFKALLEIGVVPQKDTLSVYNLVNDKMLFSPLPQKNHYNQQERIMFMRSFDYLMRFSTDLNEVGKSAIFTVSQLHYLNGEYAYEEMKKKENLTDFEQKFIELYTDVRNSILKKILRNEI